MRVSPAARCRLQRLHDVPCVEGTSLQCVHPTAGGDRVAFRADNAREHACKPARAKVRLAKSCVCRRVARAFTSLLHGRVSCHVVMSVILFPVVLFPQVNACGQLERYRRSLCTNRCLFSDMRHASRFTIDVVRDDELHVFGTRLSCTLPSLPLIVCVCQTYIHGYVYTARS